MRWVKKAGVNFSTEFFRLADPVEKIKVFDWIPPPENSVEKLEPKKLFFDCER